MKSLTARMFLLAGIALAASVGTSLLAAWVLSILFGMRFHAGAIAAISGLICLAMTIVQFTAARRMS